MNKNQQLGVTGDVFDMETDQEDEITINKPAYKIKVTVKGISSVAGIRALSVDYQSKERNCSCRLPLNEPEPPNKRRKTGYVSLKKRQNSRGGYYQINGGKSTHVYTYEQYYNGLNKAYGDDIQDYHVSHLCHHWWCCNPEHLIYEPAFVNIARKECRLNRGKCSCKAVTHPMLTRKPQKCIWYTPRVCESLTTASISFETAEEDQDKFNYKETTWEETKEEIELLLKQ